MVRKRKIDRPLRRDVRHLGALLGEVIREQEGEATLELEERIRLLAIARRRGPREERLAADRELSEILERLSLGDAEAMIRAFATYFQLVNLAEQHHRIRRARAYAMDAEEPPQRGSLAAILLLAQERGVSAAAARAAIASLEVTLTLTAHPTQAARHTILEKLDRIADGIEERDRCQQTPREAADIWEGIRGEVTSLWQTDEVRRERPTVGDEVKNVLWYAERIFWDLLPELPQVLAEAFERAYGEPLGLTPAPLRLHSWVGGDMDGNPLVTPAVVEDAIRVHQVRALRLLLAGVQELGGALSQSARHVKVPSFLLESIRRDEQLMPAIAARSGPKSEGEPWRRKLRFMEARLAMALGAVEASRSGSEPVGIPLRAPGIAPAPVLGGEESAKLAYQRPEELIADLEILERSLIAANGANAGLRQVRSLLVQARSVGFHLLELELRALATDTVDAATWLAKGGALSNAADRFLSALRKIADAQAFGGEQACRTVVLSMCKSVEDVKAALVCARAAGLWDESLGCARVDIVPLFETLEALDDAPEILRILFADPEYRRHVACRGQQEVMIGYSDSGKEVGLLAAAAALWRAQVALPAVAKQAGIPLRIFHGRGESVARGGGPAQQAILALPPGSVAGRYKATEQGEALDHKYARPALALRTLELIMGGALLHSLDAQRRLDFKDEGHFVAVFDELAKEGRSAYRSLVYDEPEFLRFFREATPLEEVSHLPIGSRPTKRGTGGLEALRAIPWVFSWTQNRSILPGWYGVGTALERFSQREGGEEELLAMHDRWPLFRTVIGNLEMVLAKSDLAIATRYAALATDEAREAVWPRIVEEYRLTKRWVKRLTKSRRLLEGNAPLRRSIELRNPYVDPMSFLQVELLRRKRLGAEGCDRPLLLTLNGIAAGLRNTG